MKATLVAWGAKAFLYLWRNVILDLVKDYLGANSGGKVSNPSEIVLKSPSGDLWSVSVNDVGEISANIVGDSPEPKSWLERERELN